ncbi:manganese efflux pump [Synechococcus sp. CCY 9618]|uniref:manganese efflux pump n=1 Tax=Synechococcus sp. CCY 9618 TaxID=2815602 RepID=UPI00352BE7A5
MFVSAITSIDPLGVGVSIGIVNKPIGIDSAAIGLGAFVSPCLGLFLRRRISGKLGSKVELLAAGFTDRARDQDASDRGRPGLWSSSPVPLGRPQLHDPQPVWDVQISAAARSTSRRATACTPVCW